MGMTPTAKRRRYPNGFKGNGKRPTRIPLTRPYRGPCQTFTPHDPIRIPLEGVQTGIPAMKGCRECGWAHQ